MSGADSNRFHPHATRRLLGQGDQSRWPMHKTEPSETSASQRADSIEPNAFGLTKVGYTIDETVKLVGIGRTSIYSAIKRGDLEIAKLGKRTIVFAFALAKFLNTLRVAPLDGGCAGADAVAQTQKPVDSSPQTQHKSDSLRAIRPIYHGREHVGDLETGEGPGVVAYAIRAGDRTRIGTFRNRRDAARAIRRGRS